MAAITLEYLNCPIETSFDLDECFTLPQDTGRRRLVSKESAASLPTVAGGSGGGKDAQDVCSVCMEGFRRPDQVGKRVPCGHVYHQSCIAEWSVHHNSCPLCRCEIFPDLA